MGRIWVVPKCLHPHPKRREKLIAVYMAPRQGNKIIVAVDFAVVFVVFTGGARWWFWRRYR